MPTTPSTSVLPSPRQNLTTRSVSEGSGLLCAFAASIPGPAMLPAMSSSAKPRGMTFFKRLPAQLHREHVHAGQQTHVTEGVVDAGVPLTRAPIEAAAEGE